VLAFVSVFSLLSLCVTFAALSVLPYVTLPIGHHIENLRDNLMFRI